MTRYAALNEGDVISVDTELERTTTYYVGADGSLIESTSTADMVITRVAVNGERLPTTPDELTEDLFDALYESGYTS